MRRNWLRGALVVSALLVLAGAAFLALAHRRPMPIIASDPPLFRPAEIIRGAQLAAIGNCNVCHTREGGAVFAGGRPIDTPFGRVMSTNITPDRDTGIGSWSLAAFTRAMREGVSQDGHHLYPAFPYDHMTRTSQDDIQAVYAFLMSREPVTAPAPPNDLALPFNFRPLIAGWKLLFMDTGVFQPHPERSEEWNRGAELVEGLGHCGSCHTPRNLLGGEKRSLAYSGGESQGWIAPALNDRSPAAVAWNADTLFRYLSTGFERQHGKAAGPMGPVVNNLRTVPESDVRAIAVYVASMIAASAPDRVNPALVNPAPANPDRALSPAMRDRGDAPVEVGGTVYAATCAACHGEAGREPQDRALHLGLSSALRVPRPDNLIRIVTEGINAEGRWRGAIMPGFGEALTDDQIVALAAFLRPAFTAHGPWSDIGDAVRRVRADRARKVAQTESDKP